MSTRCVCETLNRKYIQKTHLFLRPQWYLRLRLSRHNSLHWCEMCINVGNHLPQLLFSLCFTVQIPYCISYLCNIRTIYYCMHILHAHAANFLKKKRIPTFLFRGKSTVQVARCINKDFIKQLKIVIIKTEDIYINLLVPKLVQEEVLLMPYTLELLL